MAYLRSFRSLLLLLLVGLRLAGADPAPAALPDLLAGKRLLVLGDSITQGGTYVCFLDYYLQRRFPRAAFDIINLGLSSETTSGLSEPNHAGGKFARPCVHERLERALTAVKPQVVMACYGMNDGIYLEQSPERMQAFQDGMTRLAQAVKTHGAQLILVTPPIFEGGAFKAGAGGYDDVLAAFAAWESSSSLTTVARIDLHTAMSAYASTRKQNTPGFRFTKDHVHPGDLGHLFMAHTILKGLGLDLQVRDLDAELARITADPLYAPVRKLCQTRAGAWMNHVGYTRERTVLPGTGDLPASEAKAAELQQAIDVLRQK